MASDMPPHGYIIKSKYIFIDSTGLFKVDKCVLIFIGTTMVSKISS
jgi:hypothetical protein